MNCALIFQDHIPTEKELELFYFTYHDQIHQQQVILNDFRLVSYLLDIDFFNDSLKLHGIDPSILKSVFDYGASGGYLLDVFPSNFTMKAGWDRGDQSREVLQKKGYYYDFNTANANFDILVLRGVIEHMVNPWIDLKIIIEKINPRYILITATPNGSSIAAAVFRDQWHMHLPTEHIYHFSPHHLIQIINPYGYRMLNLEYKYLNTPYSDFTSDSDKIRKACDSNLVCESGPYFDSMINCIFQNTKL